ncbi:MAG: hypothetical protein AAB037_00615, partial [Chloroflexota bacterium]
STQSASIAYNLAVSSESINPVLSSFYDITDGLVFDPSAPAILSFVFDPTIVDTGTVSIYTFDGVDWSSTSIFNQQIAFLPELNGLALLTGEILHTSLYAPMVVDKLAPLTTYHVQGSSMTLEARLFVSSPAALALDALDRIPKGGVGGVKTTVYRLGSQGQPPGGDFVEYAGIPIGLPEGKTEAAFLSVDRAGNSEPEESTVVYLDATAPILSASADVSTFPIEGGFGIAAPTATLTIAAEDPEIFGAQSGLNAVSYTLDGATGTLAFTPGAASASADIPLDIGMHLLALEGRDRLGNASQRTYRIAVGDRTPPVTNIALGEPKAQISGVPLISPKTPITLLYEDFSEFGVPSGVESVHYRAYMVQGTTTEFRLYQSSFSLASFPVLQDGSVVIEFYSKDLAGNVETVKSTTVVLDATGPVVVLTSPCNAASGACKIFKGSFPVLGSASDLHFASYKLAYAPQGGGFTTIMATNSPVEQGTLGTWNARSLEGYHTLRLEAEDMVGYLSARCLEVYRGEPGRLLAVGG